MNLTPGISPFAFPFLPKPQTRTSSLSLMKLRQPSLGTKAVIFLPFFLRSTLTAFLIPELGYLAPSPIFSTTNPFAYEDPVKGLSHYLLRSLFFQNLEPHLEEKDKEMNKGEGLLIFFPVTV